MKKKEIINISANKFAIIGFILGFIFSIIISYVNSYFLVSSGLMGDKVTTLFLFEITFPILFIIFGMFTLLLALISLNINKNKK